MVVFFYFSADGKYTLKTISRDEFHFLRSILNNYWNHLSSNPNTLIIKFFGCHKIRFLKSKGRQKKVYFIIMANVFHTSREIHVRYDIKGSTYGRFTAEDDPSIAKKDLNMIKSGEKIFLPRQYGDIFLQQIARDCLFFEQNNIIDYSLLIGIHHISQDNDKIDGPDKTNVPLSMNRESSIHKKYFEDKFNHREGVLSADGKLLYFFGIIDVLTRFNSKKKFEYMFKRIAYGSGISAVPSKQYSQRYQQFIKSITQIS